MKNFKKSIIALTAFVFMAVSFTSCGEAAESTKAPAETTVAETTAAAPAETTAAPAETTAAPAETEAAAETKAEAAPEEDDDLQELADALDGTLWVGMDSAFNCYALAFGGTSIYIADNNDAELEGYWAISDDTLYVYADEEGTQELTNFAWDYDMDNHLLILEDAYLTQSSAADASKLGEEMEKMATACKTAEALNETYWVTISETNAEALYMKGQSMEAFNVNADGTTNEGTYEWGMDYDNIYLYDASNTLVSTMGWNFSEDGTQLILTINGTDVAYTECSEEDATDIMGYLLAALTAE